VVSGVAAGGPPSLRFRVRDLQRHSGSTEEVFGELDLSGARVGVVEVGADPVRVELVLEALRGGVRAEGSAQLTWQGECRRCLGEATGVAEVELSEMFADAVGTLDQPDGEMAELVEDGWIDMGPAVRDAVLLALPLAPLCRPGCQGPSPSDFPVSIEGGAGAEGGSEAPDPRWAALGELRFDPPPD
jgi:uncharacterized protein